MHAPVTPEESLFGTILGTSHASGGRRALRLINKSLASKILPALPQTSGVKSQRFKPTATMMTAIRRLALPEAIPLCTRRNSMFKKPDYRGFCAPITLGGSHVSAGTFALPQSKASRPIVSYVAACFVALPYATDTAVRTDFLMSYLIVPLARPFPVHMHPLSFVAPILNRATTSRWQGKDYSPLRLPSTRL